MVDLPSDEERLLCINCNIRLVGVYFDIAVSRIWQSWDLSFIYSFPKHCCRSYSLFLNDEKNYHGKVSQCWCWWRQASLWGWNHVGGRKQYTTEHNLTYQTWEVCWRTSSRHNFSVYYTQPSQAFNLFLLLTKAFYTSNAAKKRNINNYLTLKPRVFNYLSHLLSRRRSYEAIMILR